MNKKLPYDQTLPEKLKETQIWFAGIITQPLVNGYKLERLAPNGKKIEHDAKRYISPGPILPSHERIELYAQQYWWRLLKIMQEIYPFVARLFGSNSFNDTLGVPYINKYPSDEWSLNMLGRRFPQWILDTYSGNDKQLVYDAARIDDAFSECFLTINQIPINSEIPESGDMSVIIDKKLKLQDNIYLFQLPYNLFVMREQMVKEDVDHWIDHDFPELPKGDFHKVLYRTHANDVAWAEVSANEYRLLSMFKKGCSIEEACEHLENEPEEVYQDSAENLGNWFQKWVALRWLTLVK